MSQIPLKTLNHLFRTFDAYFSRYSKQGILLKVKYTNGIITGLNYNTFLYKVKLSYATLVPNLSLLY